MGEASGTLRGMNFDGLELRVPADINITLNLSEYENENIPTTGLSVPKKTLRSPDAEGVVLIVNPIEQETLRELAARLQAFPMSAELADGSVWRTTGNINFENVETQENRATVKIMPDRAIGAWELFSA